MPELKEDFEHKFHLDYEKLTVSFGGKEWVWWSFIDPRPNKEANLLANLLGRGSPCYGKDLYEEFAKTFKITPKSFLKTLRKAQYKVAVEGIDAKTLHSCVGYNRFKKTFYQNNSWSIIKPHVIQVYNECGPNVTPYLTKLYRNNEVFPTPTYLKKAFGKGFWKKACKAPITKNKHIADILRNLNEDETKEAYKLFSMSYKVLEAVASSGNLGYYRSVLPNVVMLDRLCKESRCCSKEGEVIKVLNIIRDTIRFFNTLKTHGDFGVFNYKWSYKRLHEEHDRAYKLLIEIRDKPVDFIHENYQWLPEEFTCDHGTAVLIKNSTDLKLEGQNMHHCVGGYSNSCARGTYAVYHITSISGKESTLGLSYQHRQPNFEEPTNSPRYYFKLSQHYTHSNKEPHKENKEVARGLIQDLTIVDKNPCIPKIDG